jgi:hypothetical protein
MNRAMNSVESIQGYLAGRMSSLESDAFEEVLLLDPNLAREFETSLRLREGLELLRERGALQSPPAPRISFGRRTLFAVGASAAAVVLLALWVGLRHAPPSPVIVADSVAGLHTNPGTSAVSFRHTFATARGNSQPATLSLPASGVLELRALTSSAGAPKTFRISLGQIRNEKAISLGTVPDLAADADGFVAVYADAASVRPGDYFLDVQSDGDKADAERFAFKVER